MSQTFKLPLTLNLVDTKETYNAMKTQGIVQQGELYLVAEKTSPLSEDIYFCVSSNGSDDNDGSYASPFATVNKALGKIPKNLNGHLAYVLLLDDMVSSQIIVEGFYAGTVYLMSSGGKHTLTFFNISYVSEEGCIFVKNCTAEIRITDIDISNSTKLSGVSVKACTNVSVRNSSIVFTGASIGWDTDAVHLNTFGTVVNTWEVSISGNWKNGIATNGGMVYVGNTYFSNMTGTAIAAIAGIILTNGCTFTSVSSNYWTGNGGRIFDGSQTNIPHY